MPTRFNWSTHEFGKKHFQVYKNADFVEKCNKPMKYHEFFQVKINWFLVYILEYVIAISNEASNNQ